MKILNPTCVKTQLGSDFLGIEAYIADTNMIITKHAHENRAYIGRAYRASPLTGGGQEFSALMASIFKDASDDSIMQVSLICHPDTEVPNVLCRGKTHGNDMIQELIERQANLYRQAVKPGFLKMQAPINHKYLVISLMSPVKNTEDSSIISDCLAQQNSFLKGLQNAGLTDARSLSPQELLGVYRLFANIYEPMDIPELHPLEDLRSLAFTPDQVFDFRGAKTATFNETTFSQALTTKSLPDTVVDGIFNALIGAPLNSGPIAEGGGPRINVPFIVSTTVRLANQLMEDDRIGRAIKSRKQQNALPFSLGKQNNEKVLADLEGLKKSCSDGVDKYVYAGLTYFLFAKEMEHLNMAVSNVRTLFDNHKFDTRLVALNYGPRWANSLPLNYSSEIAKAFKNETPMAASASACLLPLYSDSVGNANLDVSSGSVFLTRRGLPYYFDIFNTNTNKNGVIFAEAGAGKSFVAQYLIENALAEGTQVFFFDNGRSLEKFCDSVKGEFIDFRLDQENQSSLAPFSGITDEDFNKQSGTITELILKMAYRQGEAIDPGARNALDGAVKAAWKSGQEPSIDLVIDSLRKSSEKAMEPTKDGAPPYVDEIIQASINLIGRLAAFMNTPSKGSFFRGENKLNLQNPLVVLELSCLDADDHLKQCVMFAALNTIMERIKSQPGKKLIILDEAWQLLSDPDAAKLIEGIYRKCRKDTGSIFVITQSIMDLMESPSGKVILDQSYWRLILTQKTETIERAVKEGVLTQFKDDPWFERVLKDVYTEKGVFSEILICGRSYEVVRLFVDRFTKVLMSTDGAERSVPFEMMKRGVPAIDAVKQFIGERDSSFNLWFEGVLENCRNEKVTKDELIKLIEGRGYESN